MEKQNKKQKNNSNNMKHNCLFFNFFKQKIEKCFLINWKKLFIERKYFLGFLFMKYEKQKNKQRNEIEN